MILTRTNSLNPPPSLEAVWERLEQTDSLGVFQRIEEEHQGDFYAALDGRGRRGLVLLSAGQPSSIPDLENLDVDCRKQQDGRWRTSIWLTNKDFRAIFASLAQDVLDSTRDIPYDSIADFTTARILRWHDLLEAGGSGLGSWQLRGIIAELVVLRALFDLMAVPEAIEGWRGPLGAAQDFIFKRLRVEAKSIGPSARRVRITSADQLDVPSDVELRLVVVVLASMTADAKDGFTISLLVDDIRAKLTAHPHALREFDRRLAAVGLGDLSDYVTVFRVDGLRNFAVDGDFPRIVRASVAPGVEEVSYSIKLADIADYEKALGD
jgi:hypothetical protein